MITYEEYKQREQKAVNELPIRWAFGKEQFKNMMNEWGLKEDDHDKIYSFGGGGYFLRSDSDKVKAYFTRKDDLPELLENPEFAEEAFYYEMCNHEYGINLQRYWDVFSCFSKEELPFLDEIAIDPRDNYADILGWSADTRAAYRRAERRYYGDAEANEWY